jgi:hypothetical protein
MQSPVFRRRRLNRVCRWGGVTIAVLILALYLQGLSNPIRGIRIGRFEMDCFRGVTQLTYYRHELLGQPLIRITRGYAARAHDSFPFYVWFHSSVHPSYVEAWVPLWAWLLADGGITVLAWRRWRRWRPPGFCPKCGYDLRGLASGSACPECGRKICRTNGS